MAGYFADNYFPTPYLHGYFPSSIAVAQIVYVYGTISSETHIFGTAFIQNTVPEPINYRIYQSKSWVQIDCFTESRINIYRLANSDITIEIIEESIITTEFTERSTIYPDQISEDITDQ